VRAIANSKQIAHEKLSDGGSATVTKQGHQYTYMRAYAGLLAAPDVEIGLRKGEAMAMYSDAIREDVMEARCY
jgi:hypothetical protein